MLCRSHIWLGMSHTVDARIRAKLIKSGHTKNGEFILLEQINPNLNIDKTITHNELKQPLMGKRAEFLRMDQFQVIVCLEGTVGTSGFLDLSLTFIIGHSNERVLDSIFASFGNI